MENQKEIEYVKCSAHHWKLFPDGTHVCVTESYPNFTIDTIVNRDPVEDHPKTYIGGGVQPSNEEEFLTAYYKVTAKLLELVDPAAAIEATKARIAALEESNEEAEMFNHELRKAIDGMGIPAPTGRREEKEAENSMP